MIREHLFKSRAPADPMFRWRGGNVSRLEALTDAVFAFALTLLVVSLEVPRDYDEFMQVIRSFPAFGVTFAFMIWVWYMHYRFFRRYGLEDALTVTLNAFLLFVVLFYVYPLKYVAASILLPSAISGVSGPGSGGGTLMIVYSSGFTALFLTLALLHLRAWRFADRLELDEVERYMTRADIRTHLICAALGLVSIALAWSGGRLLPWSGLIFFALGPLLGVHGWWSGREAERILRESTGREA